MNRSDNAIAQALRLHTRGMGDYHIRGCENGFRKHLAQRERRNAPPIDEQSLSDLVALFVQNYKQGAADELDRIKDLDAFAASLGWGYEKMVRAAKFTDPCTAGELAERIIEKRRTGVN